MVYRHSESDCSVGDLAGDVGDDRAVAGELSGILIQTGEGGEVDLDVDGSPTLPVWLLLAGEEVQEDVGSDLVHGPGVVC